MARTPWLCLQAVLLCASVARAAPPAPVDRTVGGLRYALLFTGGADETAPLLVWMRGRGDRPDGFVEVWRDFPGKAEIAIPWAPLPLGLGGFAWYVHDRAKGEDGLSEAVSSAEAKAWASIAELAHGRKVIVGGFSQGAILAYAMAVRHPDAVRYAFPVAGALTRKLMPQGGKAGAPVYALHGDADTIVPIDLARTTIAALKKRGGTAELHELAGVGHTFTAVMREELGARLTALLPRE